MRVRERNGAAPFQSKYQRIILIYTLFILSAIGEGISMSITAYGSSLSLTGAIEQFIGENSTKLVFRQVNNAVVNRLPLPSLARWYLKQGLKNVESHVPDKAM